MNEEDNNLPEELDTYVSIAELRIIKMLDEDGDVVLFWQRPDNITIWEAIGMLESYKSELLNDMLLSTRDL